MSTTAIITNTSIEEVKQYMSADATLLSLYNSPDESVDATPEQVLRVLGNSDIKFFAN